MAGIREHQVKLPLTMRAMDISVQVAVPVVPVPIQSRANVLRKAVEDGSNAYLGPWIHTRRNSWLQSGPALAIVGVWGMNRRWEIDQPISQPTLPSKWILWLIHLSWNWRCYLSTCSFNHSTLKSEVLWRKNV